jgi:methylase of polypeptide subunit release factors
VDCSAKDLRSPAGLQKLLETEPALVRGKVLDMCCGIGLNTVLVAGAPGVSSVLGIDFNGVALERAAANAKVRTLLSLLLLLLMLLMLSADAAVVLPCSRVAWR